MRPGGQPRIPGVKGVKAAFDLLCSLDAREWPDLPKQGYLPEEGVKVIPGPRTSTEVRLTALAGFCALQQIHVWQARTYGAWLKLLDESNQGAPSVERSLFASDDNVQPSQELNVVGIVGAGTEDQWVEGVAESHSAPRGVARSLPELSDIPEEDVLVTRRQLGS